MFCSNPTWAHLKPCHFTFYAPREMATLFNKCECLLNMHNCSGSMTKLLMQIVTNRAPQPFPQNFISLFRSYEEHHILTHFTAAVLFKIPFLVLYDPLTSRTPLKLWLDSKDATCTLQETPCTATQRNHCRHLTHIAVNMISKCVQH